MTVGPPAYTEDQLPTREAERGARVGHGEAIGAKSAGRGVMETAQGGSSRRAAPPEGLARLFFELANEADVEGVMKLYEHDAQLAMPSGPPAIGEAALRRFYRELFLDRPRFSGAVQPAVSCEDLALT